LGLVSVPPIFWWLIIHNVITYGSLWGTSDNQVVDIVQNIELALTKMLHWFIPYFSVIMLLLTRPFILLLIIALILVVINGRSKENWLAWVRELTRPTVFPMMIYAFVYFSALALTVVTADHRFLFSDRYYVILLVPTLVVVFTTYDRLIEPCLKFSTRQISYMLIIVFCLWMIYPVYGLREYLSNALSRGEPSDYNLFNTRAYHDSKIVPEMQLLRKEHPGAIVYSNYSDAVWFYTRKPVNALPTRGIPDLKSAYAGWPSNQPGYVIWFKPNEYKSYLSPEELAKFASLKLIFTDPGGDIYYAQAR